MILMANLYIVVLVDMLNSMFNCHILKTMFHGTDGMIMLLMMDIITLKVKITHS